jgi:hypothetical protein
MAVFACGGSPTSPGPQPPPPPANAAPVIDGITVEPSRIEVGTETAVAATVRDTETPVAQLTYQWTAAAGTFNGQGANVMWRAPDNLASPQSYTLTLTVVEQYGAGSQHRVTGTSPAVRVHDSPRELSALAVTFLNDFANSSVAPEAVVRDFWDGCPGKTAELADVRDNRQYYDNLGSQIGTPRVTLDGARLRANVAVSCQFTSRAKACPTDEPQCVPNAVGTVRGECRMTGVYEQQRWWLCDSTFEGSTGILGRRFFGSR